MPFLLVGADCSVFYSFAVPEVGEMSSASDRTAYLKYCVSAGKSCVCCPKTVGIDPSHNVVCLDPACSSITTDISGQTVIADISGQTVIADISGQTVVATLDTSGSVGDAFGRLRVSYPYTMFEFSSITGPLPSVIDEATTGGAASVWISGDSYINMPVTSGQSIIRQSYEYIPYQPGKSKLVLMTGVLYTDPDATAGVTARIGTFDMTIGGVYILMENGVISVNLQKGAVPPVATPNKVLRSAWTDPLDGTGPSGRTVDFSKAQIFMFDFEWLGVGQVRCGIVQGGEILYYHRFSHINTLTSPYIQMAKLPLRYEIASTSSTNAMRMICGTVISEGGFSPPGRQWILSVDNSAQAYTLPNNNTFYPILSLSLRTGNPYNRGTIKVENIEVFDLDANVAGSWKLLLNPTITGPTAPWVDYDTARGSIARYRRDNGLGTITDEGFVVYHGYFYNRSLATFITSIDELIAAKGINSNIAGTPDIMVLVVNWLAGSNNTSLYCGLRWAEIM